MYRFDSAVFNFHGTGGMSIEKDLPDGYRKFSIDVRRGFIPFWVQTTKVYSSLNIYQDHDAPLARVTVHVFDVARNPDWDGYETLTYIGTPIWKQSHCPVHVFLADLVGVAEPAYLARAITLRRPS